MAQGPFFVRNDGSGSDTNDGLTHATAWATFGKVESTVTDDSTKVYFQSGDTWLLSAGNPFFGITWKGTGTSDALRGIVGAYFWNGSTEVIGVSGAKPIIRGNYDGSDLAVPVQSGVWPDVANKGVIDVPDNMNFIRIKNIRIEDSGQRGISFDGFSLTDAEVIDCDVDNTWRQGIILTKVTTGLIENNTVNNGTMRGFLESGPGAGVTWPLSTSITCRGNTVTDSGKEAINANRSSGGLIEDNIVFNSSTTGVLMYFDHSSTTVCRNNSFVWPTANTTGRVISFTDEGSAHAQGFTENSDLDVYNNLCYGGDRSVHYNSEQSEATPRELQRVRVIHNTFVDAVGEFIHVTNRAITWTDCEHRDNIHHSSGAEPTNGMYDGIATIVGTFTFSHNLFPSAPESQVSGTGDVTGDALLERTDWTAVTTVTDLIAADFRPTTSSPANDAGLLITGFETDHDGITRDSTPNIGAFEPGVVEITFNTGQITTAGLGFAIKEEPVKFNTGQITMTGLPFTIGFIKAATGIPGGREGRSKPLADTRSRVTRRTRRRQISAEQVIRTENARLRQSPIKITGSFKNVAEIIATESKQQNPKAILVTKRGKKSTKLPPLSLKSFIKDALK